MPNPGFSYTGTELDAMSGARNYYRWILSYLGPYVGGRVIEVGAGVGSFASALLQEKPAVSELVLVEPAQNLFPHLARRFASESRVRVIPGYLNDCASVSGMDSFIAVNVIEHVADDVEFLRLACKLLAPGATIILFAPAMAALYGTLDKTFEHYRRYRKPELAGKLIQAGFDVEDIRYLNLPGIVTWFLAGRVLRRKTIRPSQVRIYDRWVVPWVSKLERRWQPPLGQSLLAVGRKPAATSAAFAGDRQSPLDLQEKRL